jgi:hypothetical protein
LINNLREKIEYTIQAVVKFPGLNRGNQTDVVESTPFNNDCSFSFFNDVEEEGIVKLFNTFRKTDLYYIFNSNVYSNFVPNWRELREMHSKTDNIFNTYTKLSKLFRSVKNKGKIKDNNRRKQY